ncbi:MAG TPA: flavodoxin domain-containing protein [Atribacteraceae bacterium]|nr:flavodoxin domain-containing protein [Atribacteraceae bacterium]
MKALVLYHTRTGTTHKMAEIIGKTLEGEGIPTDLREPSNCEVSSLKEYDLIIIGSPTYYGTMAAEVKAFLDDSVQFHRALDGKIGGAFSSSANLAGGNETTIMSIIGALLIHGMVVKGISKGSHYGPVAVGSVDTRAEEECITYARELARLTKNHRTS